MIALIKKWFQLKIASLVNTHIKLPEAEAQPAVNLSPENSALTDVHISTATHASADEPVMQPEYQEIFFDRDLSWLSFNERVLMEAERDTVPLLERLNFLSIYSSNLDEFYRVRIPALLALHELAAEKKTSQKGVNSRLDIVNEATERVRLQLQRFGNIIRHLVPRLSEHGAYLLYSDSLPVGILPKLSEYFFPTCLHFYNQFT